MRSGVGRKKSIFRKILGFFSEKKEEVVVAEPVEMSIQIADRQGEQNVNSF